MAGDGGRLCCLQPLLFLVSLSLSFFAVQESLVSEEIVHDLDTCEVTVEGEELSAEQESLEVDVTRLQQKGIEASHSDLGVVFTGEGKALACPLPEDAHWCVCLTLVLFCTQRGARAVLCAGWGRAHKQHMPLDGEMDGEMPACFAFVP